MRRQLSTFMALLAGLLTAQVIASIHVHLSNLALHDKIGAIVHAGYQNMPNENVIYMLKTWRPAVAGGLFFTLSIGAGITLLTLAALRLWDIAFFRKKKIMLCYLPIWLSIIIAINLKGFLWMPSLYFLVVPLVVYFVYTRLLPLAAPRGGATTTVAHLACIIALAVMWSTQAGNGLFIGIRDNLLLTNPVGIKVNDFYYTYTHFSAEAISALQHKMYKTYSQGVKQDKTKYPRLAAVLADHGYFSIAENNREDIQIMNTDSQLIFLARGKTSPIFESSLKDFLANPESALKAISKKTDRNMFFRRTIFYSLLVAFPISLYMLLLAVFTCGLSFFLSPKRASLLGALFCFIVGTALLVPVHMGRERAIDKQHLPELLAAQDWHEQVTALKIISRNKLDIGEIGPYRHLVESTHIPVRYWLAQALGRSRQAESYHDLLVLLHSSQANVVCQALYSIGKRGGQGAVQTILDIIDTSSHWYILRYAYQALKDLGWQQQRLN